MYFSRRDFLKKAGATALAATTLTDLLAGPAAKKYVEDKTGSTAQIVKHLEPYI